MVEVKKLAGKTILIVDDEALLREVLVEFFSLEGATVIEAENGKIGFKKLLENKIDIIISDVRMPEGDGLSLLKQVNLADLGYKPLVFLYSGHADTLTESSVQALGATGYFIKPFSVRDLITVLTSHC